MIELKDLLLRATLHFRQPLLKGNDLLASQTSTLIYHMVKSLWISDHHKVHIKLKTHNCLGCLMYAAALQFSLTGTPRGNSFVM